MGQGLSCGGESHENGFFGAVQDGDVRVVEAMIREDPTLLEQSTVHDKLSALHFAAASGQIEVGFLLCLLIFDGFLLLQNIF